MWYQKQTDDRWKNIIYDDHKTIGNEGCLITALANIFECYPPELALIYAEHGCFDGHGGLYQNKAQKVEGLEYIRETVTIQEIDEGTPYVIWYKWKLRDGRMFEHFSNVNKKLNDYELSVYNVYNGQNVVVNYKDIKSLKKITILH